MSDNHLETSASETIRVKETVLIPFALANPSRARHAVFLPQSLQAREEQVRVFLADRGMVRAADDPVELPGITFCWIKGTKETALQTTITVLPQPDDSPDSQEDQTLDNKQDD